MDIRPSFQRRAFLAAALSGGVSALGASCDRRAFAQALQDGAGRFDAGGPSATAGGAALLRAIHQIIDIPRVLDDPLAIPILGRLQADELQRAVDRQSHGLRASVVMRSRYAEDRLAAAVARGVRQYVVLGAGLDTFAYRNPWLDALRVFEVDHPATQRMKRARLQAARIAVPSTATFVPIDFETETLSKQLAAHGFRMDEPAFFSLLGVVIYLSDAAVMDTMRVVASCAPGTEIVFSFSVPDELLTPAQRAARQRATALAARLGEPWITFYNPSILAEALRERGFSATELFAPEDANRTYFARRLDGLRTSTGHMMSARV